MDPSPFFAYARERQSILLRRRAGRPRSEWTANPILRENRFCNVFREDDRTTVWFRGNVRERLRTSPDVLLATVVFRWFNRIKTGEAIFTRTDLTGGGVSAWDCLLNYKNTPDLRKAILEHVGWGGPFVTGAYIIKTPNGMSKLDGVLWCIEQFASSEWRDYAKKLLYKQAYGGSTPLEEVWSWLCQFPSLGKFMAYEIVSDLRYTDLLDKAPDIMTWANAGPGATRGLNRLHGRELEKAIPAKQQSEEMQILLRLSQDELHWPQKIVAESEIGDISDWPAWDMRTVEHTLCEFDKIERVRCGEGRMKQRFKPHEEK